MKMDVDPALVSPSNLVIKRGYSHTNPTLTETKRSHPLHDFRNDLNCGWRTVRDLQGPKLIFLRDATRALEVQSTLNLFIWLTSLSLSAALQPRIFLIVDSSAKFPFSVR